MQMNIEAPGHDGTLYLLSAFTETPEGGNPAGVWIGDQLPESEAMQRIASDVGFSETVFLAPREGALRIARYYSPEAEVPFCGHATIAAGVQLGALQGDGRYRFDTAAGAIMVDVRNSGTRPEASLTSVEPRHSVVEPLLLEQALGALGWKANELDPAIPPAMAFAGAWHLVVAVREAERLAQLDYHFARLKALMLDANLTTLQLVRRVSADVFLARNPFPVGGVIEDPATGAAAAALGGYLRDARLIEAPASILIRQGEAMGRPSRLHV
ncbi:MAG TPA: PhzF family phenazine biosynthesis protein, partial [Thermoanaerobaculia bacterium]